MLRKIISILFATIWISFSEFFRNEFLLKNIWVGCYKNLGLVFPENNINGLVWGIWSLLFAFCIFFISKKFSFFETVIISWLMGFVLMWMAIGNLGFLPYSILLCAIPLSLIEVIVAVLIIKKSLLKKQ